MWTTMACGRTTLSSATCCLAALWILALACHAAPSPEAVAAQFTGVPPERWVRRLSVFDHVAELEAFQDETGRIGASVDMRHQRLCGLYYWDRLDPPRDEKARHTVAEGRTVAEKHARLLAPEFAAQPRFEDDQSDPEIKARNAFFFMWCERQGEAYTGKVLVISIAVPTLQLVCAQLRLPPPWPVPKPRVSKTTAVAALERELSSLGEAKPLVQKCDLVLSQECAPKEGPVWRFEVRYPNGHEDLLFLDAVSARLLPPK